MQKRNALFILVLIVLSIISVLVPYSAQANQPENPVVFVEGQEPLQMNYGEYTVGARIEDPTDTDRFSFSGSAGDNIRVMVSRESGYIYPNLEIWDPNGDKIVDTWSTSDISVDETLVTSGTYKMVVSDNLQDYTGDYTLELEKIPPVFDPPGISYDIPVSDRIDHSTDIDFFVFQGEEGNNIRVMVSRESGYIYPNLEIWDPNGDKIVDTWSTSDISVDETLVISGAYSVVVSDNLQDYTGDYAIEIQCLGGSCPNFPQLSMQMILNEESFYIGDTMTVSVHVMNGPDPGNVEIKTWITLPDGVQISILDPYFTFTVEPDADFTAEIFSYTFNGSEASGDYVVGCRFLNPISGRDLGADVQSFSFTP